MKNSDSLMVFTDGASRGNPGPAAYGFVIYDQNNEQLIKQGKKIGVATNNTAEYTAVLEALKWVWQNCNVQPERITVNVDSLLIASQLSGSFKVKNQSLKKFYGEIKKIETQLTSELKYNYIPREANKIADSIVNEVLDN